MFRRSPKRIGLSVAAATVVLVGVFAGAATASTMIDEPSANLATTHSVALVAPKRGPVCETVIYTPTSAAAPMRGEWCVPARTGGEVVILVHGGGGYEGDPADVTVWRDEYLDAGRSTFVIEYTLLDPASEVIAYPRPEQNVMAAVQYARMNVSGDVVLHGFSAGARLAAVAATAADDPAFAGTELYDDVSSAVDGTILFYGYYDGAQFHGERYYGPSGAPAEASAIEMASADDPAMLIVHGTDDVMTDPAGAVEFAAALDDAGVDAELLLVEGENHVFDGYGADELTEAGAALAPTIDAYLDDL